MGKEIRTRCLPHIGSPKDIMEDLKAYGLSEEHIITDLGGTCHPLETFTAMMYERRTTELASEASEVKDSRINM